MKFWADKEENIVLWDNYEYKTSLIKKIVTNYIMQNLMP